MSNPYNNNFDYIQRMQKPKRKRHPLLIHIVLFAITVLTTIMAGTVWAYKDIAYFENWHYGISYSILILTFLSAHEFGHYFAAKYHKVNASLPYYIPFPIIPEFIPVSFGTMGAVIKTRTPIPDSKALFDIGIAGPLSGFVVCLGFLIYGLMTLPPIDYLYHIHPEYLIKYNGEIPATSLFFGDTLLFYPLAKIFANPNGFLPPMNEIYHYPFLLVGWFGLFVTSLNLIPVGQLDGGHIFYAMFGRKQWKIAKYFWWFLMILGASAFLGFIRMLLIASGDGGLIGFFRSVFLPPLDWIHSIAPWIYDGWPGWLFWALILKLVIKIRHPQIFNEEKLDKNRMIFGWVAIVILVLSFSLNGIYFVE